MFDVALKDTAVRPTAYLVSEPIAGFLNRNLCLPQKQKKKKNQFPRKLTETPRVTENLCTIKFQADRLQAQSLSHALETEQTLRAHPAAF